MKTFIHTINVVSDNEPAREQYLTDTICRSGKFRSIYNLNKPNKLETYDESLCEKKELLA